MTRPKKFHLMVDIETMATTQDAIVLTLGAVKFSPHEDGFLDELYLRISITEQARMGRRIMQETMDWWATQDPTVALEAVKEEGKVSIQEAMNKFVAFAVGCDHVWSQGAAFDVPILEHVLGQLGKQVPWKYHMVRDTRTAYDFLPEVKFHLRGGPGKHNALEDAKQQVLNVQEVYKAIKERSEPKTLEERLDKGVLFIEPVLPVQSAPVKIEKNLDNLQDTFQVSETSPVPKSPPTPVRRVTRSMTKNTLESVEVEKKVAFAYVRKVVEKKNLLRQLEVLNSEIADLKSDIASIEQ